MGAEADMTFISWNRKVQQILASCSTSGKTSVWDTRRQKPVANLLDLNRFVSEECNSFFRLSIDLLMSQLILKYCNIDLSFALKNEN